MDQARLKAYCQELRDCADRLEQAVDHPSFAAGGAATAGSPPWLATFMKVFEVLKQILNAIPTTLP